MGERAAGFTGFGVLEGEFEGGGGLGGKCAGVLRGVGWLRD